MAIKPDYHATASDSCYLYPDQLHKSLVMPGNILMNSFDLNNLEGRDSVRSCAVYCENFLFLISDVVINSKSMVQQ